MKCIKQNELEKKNLTIVADSKRHKPLSLLLMLVGGDKTKCVCMGRSKNCTECRIQEAGSCENVKGNIDN